MTGYDGLTAKLVKHLKHKMTSYRGVYGIVPSYPSRDVIGISTRHRFLRVWL